MSASSGRPSTHALPPFDLARFAALLRTRTIGRELRYHAETGSTNDDALRLAYEGAPEGTVVVADFQTAGRGRHGRTWLAPARSALLASAILRPQTLAQTPFLITAAAALATRDAAASVGVQAQLKWPNDVVCRGRKLAGVLAQAQWRGARLDAVVVGIGLNANLDQAALDLVGQPATSLLVERGCTISREETLAMLLASLEHWYERVAGPGWTIALDAWRSASATLGRRVAVRRAGRADGTLHGVADDIDADGALLVRLDDGSLCRCVDGDVEVREA